MRVVRRLIAPLGPGTSGQVSGRPAAVVVLAIVSLTSSAMSLLAAIRPLSPDSPVALDAGVAAYALVVAVGLWWAGSRTPVLALHVPEPKYRPGDTPDFSGLAIPPAGAQPRPDSAVAAADTVFIDNRSDNVEAAQALGITGHLFTGPEPLRLFVEGLAGLPTERR